MMSSTHSTLAGTIATSETLKPVVSALGAASNDRELISAAALRFGTSTAAVSVCRAGPTPADSRVLWVNEAFERLSGYRSTEVVGRPATVLAGAHVDRIHMSEIELLREHPEQMPFGIVTTKQRPDQSWYDVEERLVLIRNHRNETTHFLLVQTEL